MAMNDSEITQLLTEAPPAAPAQADTDTAKTSSASDAAQKLVDVTSSPAARPLSQPNAAGWRQPVDVAKDAAISRPNAPSPGSFADHYLMRWQTHEKAHTPRCYLSRARGRR